MCRRSLGGRGRDAHFHNLEPRERGDHDRPGRPPDFRGPAHLLVFEHDVDLQDDSLALDVLELQEGLLGDIYGLLNGCVRSARKFARRQSEGTGTYVVSLTRGNVHHSRGIAICEDIGGYSRRRHWP